MPTTADQLLTGAPRLLLISQWRLKGRQSVEHEEGIALAGDALLGRLAGEKSRGPALILPHRALEIAGLAIGSMMGVSGAGPGSWKPGA